MFKKEFPRAKFCATDWLEHIAGIAPAPGDFDIVQVAFKNTRNGFYTNPNHLRLKIGDVVAVDAAPGHDIGTVVMTGPLVRVQMKKNGVKPDQELHPVFRIARQNDLERFREAKAREEQTMIRSRKIAAELGLEMKIGDVEYQGDGQKAIFYYIANERVDFRKLIRILADTFKIRIEMKQIGARQEAGRIGGIGPCGRPLCCATWITHFVSVGTSAARMQDLSMNPQKLAGQCAKLKCCINYESDSYTEAHKDLPARDITLETKDATYHYFKADILARTISYSTDKNIPVNLRTIPAARAFEIIALNKQGIKVDDLLEASEHEKESRPEYFDLAEQESLTRFDKSKKKKKRRKEGERKKAEGERKKPDGERKKVAERPDGLLTADSERSELSADQNKQNKKPVAERLNPKQPPKPSSQRRRRQKPKSDQQ